MANLYLLGPRLGQPATHALRDVVAEPVRVTGDAEDVEDDVAVAVAVLVAEVDGVLACEAVWLGVTAGAEIGASATPRKRSKLLGAVAAMVVTW